MPYVMPLSEIKPLNLEIAGSKCVDISSFYPKFKVPEGFVVTTLGFLYFLESKGIKNRINELLSDLNDANIQKTANEIQKLIIETPFPDDLASLIIENYLALGYFKKASAEELLNAPTERISVAVRPSYNEETKSKAESYISILNIKGENEVLTSIKVVFAAVFTFKNISKRKELGLNLFPKIAVIVERMINSDKSALAYTDDTEIRINAVYGLGEGLKDKDIIPDEYTVEKESLEIESVKFSEQKIKYELNLKSGKINKVILGNIGKIQKLCDKEITETAKIAIDAGEKKSVKIAISGSDFYIIGVKNKEGEQKIEIYDIAEEKKLDNDKSVKDEIAIYDSILPQIEKQEPLLKKEIDFELSPKEEYVSEYEKFEEGVVNYDEEDDLKEEFDKEDIRVYENEEQIERKLKIPPIQELEEPQDSEKYMIYEPDELFKEPKETEKNNENRKEAKQDNKKISKKKEDEETEKYPDEREETKKKRDEEEDDSIFSSLKTY